jgi:hypothetical protein
MRPKMADSYPQATVPAGELGSFTKSRAVPGEFLRERVEVLPQQVGEQVSPKRSAGQEVNERDLG